MTSSPILQRLIVGFCAMGLFFVHPVLSEAQEPAGEAYVRATLQAEGQRWNVIPDQVTLDAYERATLEAGGQRLVNAPDQAAIDALVLATMEAEGQVLTSPVITASTPSRLVQPR